MKHLHQVWETQTGLRRREKWGINLSFNSDPSPVLTVAPPFQQGWHMSGLLESPLIFSPSVCVCMCVSPESWLYIELASGCGPGKTKHWRRSSPRLTSCGPEAAAVACYYSVCVCVFDGGAPLQAGGEWSLWGFGERDVNFGACVWVWICEHTHSHTHVITVSVIYVQSRCITWARLEPEEVWFVVCHHPSCLGTVGAPGQIHQALRYLVYLAKRPSYKLL